MPRSYSWRLSRVFNHSFISSIQIVQSEVVELKYRGSRTRKGYLSRHTLLPFHTDPTTSSLRHAIEFSCDVINSECDSSLADRQFHQLLVNAPDAVVSRIS